MVRLGGPKVQNLLRARAGESANGGLSSNAPFLNQRPRFKSVLDVIQRVLYFSWARTFSAKEESHHCWASGTSC